MNELITALRGVWDDPAATNRNRMPALPRHRPIAGSQQDQQVPDGVDNPLWDVVRWMPAEPYWHNDSVLRPTFASTAFEQATAARLINLGAERTTLRKQYAWSIITPGDVTWMLSILNGRAVVEIGAGSGYWAWQLEQAGVDVAAYDPNPVSGVNEYCTSGPYTTVLADDATAVKHHQDRVLLMVWPPYGGEHAGHALSLYEGDLLIYAGEGAGGCTADDAFFELLDAEWDLLQVAPRHVTWWGIHCELAAYRRRERAA